MDLYQKAKNMSIRQLNNWFLKPYPVLSLKNYLSEDIELKDFERKSMIIKK